MLQVYIMTILLYLLAKCIVKIFVYPVLVKKFGISQCDGHGKFISILLDSDDSTKDEYTITRSTRGAMILNCEGFQFRQDYIHGERISWRCTMRHKHRCKATAVTLGSKLVKTSERHTHNIEK